MELIVICLVLAVGISGVVFASLTLMGYFDKSEQPYKDWWIAEATKVLRKKTKYSKEWCKDYAETLFEDMMQGFGTKGWESCEPEEYVLADMEYWEYE